MTLRQIVAMVTLTGFVVFMQGCTSRYSITPESYEKQPDRVIAKVVTIHGEVLEFKTDKGNRATLKEGAIEGYLKDGTFRSIPLSNIKDIETVKVSTGKTIGAVMLSLALVAVVVLTVAFASGPSHFMKW